MGHGYYCALGYGFVVDLDTLRAKFPALVIPIYAAAASSSPPSLTQYGVTEENDFRAPVDPPAQKLVGFKLDLAVVAAVELEHEITLLYDSYAELTDIFVTTPNYVLQDARGGGYEIIDAVALLPYRSIDKFALLFGQTVQLIMFAYESD